MPRPILTRARIVAAGVSIVGDMGFAALGIRAVARRVNATAVGVQRQIGATELQRAVAAEIIASMPAFSSRDPWHRRIRVWALEMRAWLRQYPGLARYLLDNRWENPMGLDRVEEIVAQFIQAGMTAPHSVVAARAVYWYVLSSTDLDERAGLDAEFSQETILALADRWPMLSAEATKYSESVAEAQFTLGLDLMLEGSERLAGSHAVRTVEEHLARRTDFSVSSR